MILLQREAGAQTLGVDWSGRPLSLGILSFLSGEFVNDLLTHRPLAYFRNCLVFVILVFYLLIAEVFFCCSVFQ